MTAAFAQKGDFKKLTTKDLKKGSGRAAKKGDSVTVLYIGKFKDGKVFDSNMDDKYKQKQGSEPFTLTLGAGQVIKGWDQGLVGAKAGMVRELHIPYSLGYGDRGAGGVIPPKTDLVFVVKVLKVQAGS
ncbi:MAG: FKBP-type peptidyl-prolyl cis-trans isomerase [Armatimonadetes bacterium]|nr:FKBP-type peptidyl-prolyl cis-trans isomerase [Armatimonadota bacterium]MBS1725745.1 FKBP-type peptidyl-prolyl cis-trans isomerase [Armatimonadota bacterium]